MFVLWNPCAKARTKTVFGHLKNGLYLKYINLCCLINHVKMHSFRSIIEATEKLKQYSGNFPGSGCIWTAFRPGEGGIWTTIFQKFKCRGVARRGGGCWSFDLTGTLVVVPAVKIISLAECFSPFVVVFKIISLTGPATSISALIPTSFLLLLALLRAILSGCTFIGPIGESLITIFTLLA